MVICPNCKIEAKRVYWKNHSDKRFGIYDLVCPKCKKVLSENNIDR